MTDRAKQIREKIARMDDLMDDLTDDQLLQEVTEQGWDVAAVARASRKTFKRAQVLLDLKRLSLVG
jgi:UDP-glucose/GDP-mannose dehydrogenase family, UDP binding domain